MQRDFRWEYNHRAANVPYFQVPEESRHPVAIRYSGLICLPQRFHGLQRIANKHVVPDLRKTENRATLPSS